MVIIWIFWAALLFGEEPKIDFWFESSTIQEELPIDATFIITHEASEPVDKNSFRLDQKKIEATLLTKKSVGPLLIETYRFSLPPLGVGEYRFEGFFAKVGGSEIKANPETLRVIKIESAASPRSSAAAFLEITPILEKGPKLYPGMELTLGYRYRFKGAILLKEETLPLIDGSPFEKLGDKMIQDGVENGFSTRTIFQKFKVNDPGDYPVKESFIAGYSYYERPGGQKVMIEPKLISKIPPFTITVLPFPEKGKPPFFNGILGPFSVTADLLTRSDPVKLKVSFSGKGEVNTLIAPDLRCMPGFNLLFTFDEPGPLRDNQSFIYELKPKANGAVFIPEIVLATFNPATESYTVIETKSIPFEMATSTDKEGMPPIIAAKMAATPFTPKSPWEEKPSDIPYERARLFYDRGYLEEALFILRKAHSHPEKIDVLQELLGVKNSHFSRTTLYFGALGTLALALLIAALLKSKKGALFTLLIALVAGVGFYYMRPMEAQLLKPTFLYKSPHLMAPKAGDAFLQAGSDVEVLEVVDQGRWLKVHTPHEEIGFIPFDAAALF